MKNFTQCYKVSRKNGGFEAVLKRIQAKRRPEKNKKLSDEGKVTGSPGSAGKWKTVFLRIQTGKRGGVVFRPHSEARVLSPFADRCQRAPERGRRETSVKRPVPGEILQRFKRKYALPAGLIAMVQKNATEKAFMLLGFTFILF